MSILFFLRIEKLLKKSSTLREIYLIRKWIHSEFATVHTYRCREHLWEAISCFAQPSFTVYEFGVAHGYISKYWVRRGFIKGLKNWYGYDTFTGLPQKWRNIEKGSFSNSGKIPTAEDSRIIFIKGDIFETWTPPETRKLGEKYVLIFDFDLYEPSMFVLNSLLPKLQSQDILYFDEAFSIEESSIIMEILKQRKFHMIGATFTSLAISII